MTFRCTLGAPPHSIFLFVPLKTVALPSQTIFIQRFITIIKHTHEKKKKKKINSKRQRGQKPGFGRLIFIFSFLSSILLCLLFSFRSEKWKETCLFFQPVPHYGAFQVCSFVWGRPQSRAQTQRSSRLDYPDWCQHFDRATNHSRKRPLPSAAWTLHALISVAKQPCQD